MKAIIPTSLPGTIAALAACLTVGACASDGPPIETVAYVDLDRFMGDWYVIANIPTFLEKDAYNAVESYQRNDDGTIATTFVYRKGGFDGKRKEYNPRAWVLDEQSNAVWGMQFVWPIKADYRIVYLTEDYSQTVIARNKRDYVWLMARKPTIDDDDYYRISSMIESLGYDISKLRKVPQQW
jgi:apolipoprotein D and lipocalin family protein